MGAVFATPNGFGEVDFLFVFPVTYCLWDGFAKGRRTLVSEPL
jgi:hypothetical protein